MVPGETRRWLRGLASWEICNGEGRRLKGVSGAWQKFRARVDAGAIPTTWRRRAQQTGRPSGRERSPMHSSQTPSAGRTESPGNALASVHCVHLCVNGQDHHVEIPSEVTLLDLLRERLNLMGTKKGCDHGQCGACTVLANGQRINACLTLAVMQEGADITTVEGLPALAGEGCTNTGLHPLQQAFIDHDAFQCGYCTPGQLCSAVGLMSEGGARTADEVRERMSGNLCRCGAYPQIVQAIAQVAGIQVDTARSPPPAVTEAAAQGSQA